MLSAIVLEPLYLGDSRDCNDTNGAMSHQSLHFHCRVGTMSGQTDALLLIRWCSRALDSAVDRLESAVIVLIEKESHSEGLRAKGFRHDLGSVASCA